jgi:hypothetical protein
MQPIPSPSHPLAGLPSTAQALSKNTEKLVEQATTPVAPDKPAQPGSAAQLDSAGFLQRAQQGGVASGKTAGVSLTVNGSASTHQPFVDLPNIGANPAQIPDVQLRGGGQIDLRFTSREKTDGSGFYLGLRGDMSAAASTQGLPEASATAHDLMQRAEGLQSEMNSLQGHMEALGSKLQNSPGYQRLEALVAQASSNPASLNSAALTEMKQILNSGEVQGILKEMNQSLGEVNSLLGNAGATLGAVGDGQRSLSGDAAVRGAAEIYGGYRSPAVELGDSRWKARFGIEAAAIVPLPAPKQPDNAYGLPQFKSAMSKVAVTAQLTTRGFGDIQKRLGQMQSDLSNLQQSLGQTAGAIDDATTLANQIDPNNTLSVLAQLGKIEETLQTLEQSSAQAATAGEALNQSLEGLAEDIGQAEIKPALGLTTLSATAPVGFGIRDIGMDLYGPLTEKIHANLEAGVMNPVGYLGGEENHYQLSKTGAEGYQFEQVSSQKRNVFHDFYDPAVYTGVGLTANADSAFRTDLRFRGERSLTADTLRGSAIIRQQTGPVSFSTGVLNTDLTGGGKTMYMVGVGIGKNDVFSIQAATNSFSADQASDVQVQAGFRIPF